MANLTSSHCAPLIQPHCRTASARPCLPRSPCEAAAPPTGGGTCTIQLQQRSRATISPPVVQETLPSRTTHSLQPMRAMPEQRPANTSRAGLASTPRKQPTTLACPLGIGISTTRDPRAALAQEAFETSPIMCRRVLLGAMIRDLSSVQATAMACVVSTWTTPTGTRD